MVKNRNSKNLFSGNNGSVSKRLIVKPTIFTNNILSNPTISKVVTLSESLSKWHIPYIQENLDTNTFYQLLNDVKVMKNNANSSEKGTIILLEQVLINTYFVVQRIEENNNLKETLQTKQNEIEEYKEKLTILQDVEKLRAFLDSFTSIFPDQNITLIQPDYDIRYIFYIRDHEYPEDGVFNEELLNSYNQEAEEYNNAAAN